MAILPGISGPQDVKRLDAKQLDELGCRTAADDYRYGFATGRPSGVQFGRRRADNRAAQGV